MSIEGLIFEISHKNDSLKHINNYIIDEVNDNWCSYKGQSGDFYNKIISLLHANLSIIESIDRILQEYQEEIDELP